MANFMKVDFQDRLSENAHCLDEAVFFYETFENLIIKSVMRASEQIIVCSENRNLYLKNTFYLHLIWLENEFK